MFQLSTDSQIEKSTLLLTNSRVFTTSLFTYAKHAGVGRGVGVGVGEGGVCDRSEQEK